jgi:hypothetical protein
VEVDHPSVLEVMVAQSVPVVMLGQTRERVGVEHPRQVRPKQVGMVDRV